MTPYPTDVVTPCQILYGRLSGNDTPNQCCVHAAYQLVGAGLARFYPDSDGEIMMRGTPTSTPSDEEGLELLKQGSTMKGPITDMILQQLMAFALAKLQEWLKR